MNLRANDSLKECFLNASYSICFTLEIKTPAILYVAPLEFQISAMSQTFLRFAKIQKSCFKMNEFSSNSNKTKSSELHSSIHALYQQ